MKAPRLRERLTRDNLIGFCIPLVLALLIGWGVHAHYSKPAPLPDDTTAASSASQSEAATGPLPTASEIAAANAAILAYCSNDLRSDTNCSLVANSNATAPGFVESGISESGHYETGNNTTAGEALAKGSGSSWTVIWLGQGCIPQNIAEQNNVPNTLSICSS
ncbi:MAG: hypothetical protein WDN27_02675 [Candidatus Saccharibacteria bacterium]